MRFVQFTAKEIFNSFNNTWEDKPTTLVIPENMILLSFTDNVYFICLQKNEKDRTYYKLSAEEWNRMAEVLTQKPEPTEAILKRVVQNAIKELELEKRD